MKIPPSDSSKTGRLASAAPPPRKPEAIRIPMQWVWHYGVLHALRDRLLKDRGDQVEEAAEPLERHSMDIADSATDEFDHDMALVMLAHDQDALFEVDAAIRRILDGKYGICEETGKPIAAARLRAVPWTRYTKKVEERLEQEGQVGPLRLTPVASLQGPGPAGLTQIEEPEEENLQGQEIARYKHEEAMNDLESEVAKEELSPNPGEEETSGSSSEP